MRKNRLTETKDHPEEQVKSETRGRTAVTDDIVELIRMRRSIRHMTGERLPDEDLELIFDAARYAPSPENMQMWRFVVIRDDAEMKRLIADISQEGARYVFGNVYIGVKFFSQNLAVQFLFELFHVTAQLKIDKEIAACSIFQFLVELLIQLHKNLSGFIDNANLLLLVDGHKLESHRDYDQGQHKYRSKNCSYDEALGPDNLDVFSFND